MTSISMTRLFRSVLALAFVCTIALPVTAQEYKEAYNAALTAV